MVATYFRKYGSRNTQYRVEHIITTAVTNPFQMKMNPVLRFVFLSTESPLFYSQPQCPLVPSKELNLIYDRLSSFLALFLLWPIFLKASILGYDAAAATSYFKKSL